MDLKHFLKVRSFRWGVWKWRWKPAGEMKCESVRSQGALDSFKSHEGEWLSSLELFSQSWSQLSTLCWWRGQLLMIHYSGGAASWLEDRRLSVLMDAAQAALGDFTDPLWSRRWSSGLICGLQKEADGPRAFLWHWCQTTVRMISQMNLNTPGAGEWRGLQRNQQDAAFFKDARPHLLRTSSLLH